MAKLVDLAPGKRDPFVRWSLYRNDMKAFFEGCGFCPDPPVHPDGYSDGCWKMERIDQVNDTVIAVKWVFRPDDRERCQQLERSMGELLGALRSVFCPGTLHATIHGYAIKAPDTSQVRNLWEVAQKWAMALRGQRKE